MLNFQHLKSALGLSLGFFVALNIFKVASVLKHLVKLQSPFAL